MGQYHRLVNLDKQEWVDAHLLGLGVKQYEHTGFEGSLSDAMYLLVMSSPAEGGGDFPMTDVSGRWCGDRVVILGDYTKANAIPGFPNADTLYQIVEATYRNISSEVREGLAKVFNLTYGTKMVGNIEFITVSEI